MDDLIRRQEAIDMCLRMEAVTGYDAGCLIAQLPSAQPQRWIPCSERLPEEDTDILVTYVNGEETRIIPVNYGRGTWFDCIFDRALDSHNVIAWMLLPAPYRKEGEK